MIAHFSLPARDTRATAELFGKIIDGEVMPFPVVPGSWVAIARDGSGVGVEVLPPEGTARYLAFYNPQVAGAMFAGPPPAP